MFAKTPETIDEKFADDEYYVAKFDDETSHVITCMTYGRLRELKKASGPTHNLASEDTCLYSLEVADTKNMVYVRQRKDIHLSLWYFSFLFVFAFCCPLKLCWNMFYFLEKKTVG